jgi:hydrogenase expression/formation protein HypD
LSSSDPFNDPALCRKVLEAVRSEIHGRLRFMEVCGTHTVSIFRSGISSLLPEDVIHISGPGCPVCVTHESEVAAYLEAARNKNVIIATFGDLMRVPGPKGANLKSIQAEGGSISIVYSPFDSLALAAQNPDKEVVFLGIGFETTAPTVAATILGARKQGLRNFSVLPMHKLVPPAMRALLADEDVPALDAFLLPGHVSTIIGMEPYRFLAEEHGLTGVIAGFEALDILQALLIFIRRQESGQAGIINNYKRAVADNGNPKAREIMYQVYEPSDALWRGLGVIPESGLTLRPEFAGFNAFERLGIELPDVPPIPGCKCGEVLKGRMRPDQCPLFGKACTPASPVGPCMVSTEGSCAAYYKYKV